MKGTIGLRFVHPAAAVFVARIFAATKKKVNSFSVSVIDNRLVIGSEPDSLLKNRDCLCSNGEGVADFFQ